MDSLKLSDVNLVLADPRNQVRNSLRMALNEAGLRNNNMKDGTEIATVAEAMRGMSLPDILICDADLGSGEIFKMFHAIRHNEIGQNPFLAIIAISWDPTESLVEEVVNSGADFLIAAPFAPQQILDRIKSMVHTRGPFIVTSDYVGPDRRGNEDRDSNIPLIDVPNSLREKALGEFDLGRMRRAIQTTMGVVNSQKMERHAIKLAENAALVADVYATLPETVDPRRLDQLQTSAANLKWLARDAGLAHVGELCEALQTVIHKVRSGPAQDFDKAIQLMKQLSFAIRAAVDPKERTADLARNIADVISSR